MGLLLDMLVAKREPAPCYHDDIRWVSLNGRMGGRAGRFTVRPQFLPVANVFFWLVNGLFIFLGGGGMDASYWSG